MKRQINSDWWPLFVLGPIDNFESVEGKKQKNAISSNSKPSPPRSHPFRLLCKLPGNVLLLYNRGRRDRTRISFQSANDISFAIIHHSCIRLITWTSHLDGHCTSARLFAEKVTLNGRINFPVRVLNNLNMRPIDFCPRDPSYFVSRVNDFN